jgi:hypothetical protein
MKGEPMKTYPAKWTTAQLSYFAGLISSEALLQKKINMVELERMLRECSYPLSSPGIRVREIRFTEFVARLEPHISVDQWASIVGCCQRIFA